MKILSAKEDSFTNLKFKVQSQQRRIKLPKIPWLDALKLPRNTGENKLVVEKSVVVVFVIDGRKQDV